MSDETTVESVEAVEAPPAEEAQAFEERPSVHRELVANVGRAKEARSFEKGGETPPPAGKAEPGPLPDDVAELDVFLTANPDVREQMIQAPESEEQVRANLALAREAMRGREAASQMTQAEQDAAISFAYEQVMDGDPEDAAAAINALVEQVGLGPEAGEVIRFWSEQDPEASGEWLAAAQGAVAQYQQDGEAQQWQQYEADVQAWNEQTTAAAETAVAEFDRTHPDAEPYLAEMAQLGVESSLLTDPSVLGDPKLLLARLQGLHEAVRQTDPTTIPQRGPDGTWNVPASYEVQEGLNLLNAGTGPRNEHEIRRLEEKADPGIFYNRQTHQWEATAASYNTEAIEQAMQPRMTKQQVEAAESKRMAEEVFGQTASVRDELHPGTSARRQANRLAGIGSADKGPPTRDPDDPGGFWAYTTGS